jgi:FkbM family methyltransferase
LAIKHEIRKLLWKVGLDLSRFTPGSHPIARRRQLFKTYSIDLVLDVGANAGYYAKQLRNEIGYSGKIASFEPVRAPFQKLAENAKNDPKWDAFDFALGDMNGKMKINIAGNSFSSSILNMLPAHEKAAPESKYIARETIVVRKLDSVFNEKNFKGKNIYLKMDTQGFESKVIKGAERSLPGIDTIQLEMSLTPLYKKEVLFPGMYSLLSGKGYSLVSIEPGFSNFRTGQQLQVDGIFHRY